MAEETSSTSPDNPGKSQVDQLVERGLKQYAAGALRDAMKQWEEALALDPSSQRAREYLDYVCDNFDLLAAHFEAAAEAASIAVELDVPFGLESVGDDGDAYDLVQVEPAVEGSDEAPGAEAPASSPAANSGIERYIESVDEGWFLDAEDEEPGKPAAALPPPPEPAAPADGGVGFLDPDVATSDFLAAPSSSQPPTPEPESEVAEELVYEMEAELPPDDAPGFDLENEAPFAGPPRFEVPDSAFDLAQRLVGEGDPAEGPELALEPKDEPDDDTGTIELGPSGVLGGVRQAGPAVDLSGLALEQSAGNSGDYDDEMTVERGAAHGAPLPVSPPEVEEEEVTVPGGDEPLPFTEKLSLSQDALAAIRPRGVVSAHPDEPTVERPGIVKRGFALRNLDELDDGMRRDDRVLDDEDDEGPEVRVTFRHREESQGDGYLDDELTTERHAGAGLKTPVLEEELTVERRSDSSGGPSPAVIIDESLLGEEFETVDRRLEPDSEAAREAEFTAGQETKKLDRRAVSLSADLSVNEIADAVLHEIDAEVVAEESSEDRIRRRVTRLLEEAARHSSDGRQTAAVAIIELALSEDPDSATAQKVVHRHRDLLVEIYELFLGDMDAVPILAVPMNELSTEQLDSRSVFLLSRLDGTLSYEEVLDVSGMPRLEAFRYLSRMLLRGILRAR